MSSLNVNTIGEYTSGSGVTIDSLLIKDGSINGLITMADSWRITSNFTLDSPNGIVDTNWERVDTDSYGTIGS